MKRTMDKIVVVGSSNVDTVIRVPHIPAAGETLMARGVDAYFGGKGANQATAIARLDGDVTFLACVGDDDFGRTMLQNLNDSGVITDSVVQLKDTLSGAAYIYVSDSGENNIVVNAGANSCLTKEIVKEYRTAIESASYCIIQLEIPLDTLYYVAELCQSTGVKLILNPAPAHSLDFEKLKNSWMIIPNEGELNSLVPDSGDIEDKARKLLNKGFEHVLVTLGSQGCLLVNSDGEKRYPAYTAPSVVDTTAAGDSFIGALAVSLSKGQSIEKSIDFAAKAAAITVSRVGAQPSLPKLREVETARLTT